MMTQKERFLALLHHEPTDGFVNQYGAVSLLMGKPPGAHRHPPLPAAAVK